jgi:halocyanin-like protein
MSDVGNYEGVVDATGQSEVSVTVGAAGNGGNYAFNPPAVQVDPGTTVVWEWTGEGQQHNVLAEEGGEFESELTGEAGFTFEHTFDSEGVVKYSCTPHRTLGMKGVVVVGDVDTGAETIASGSDGDSAGSGESGGGESGGGESSERGGTDEGSGTSGISLDQGGLVMSLVVGVSLVVAFLSPFVFGVLLWLRNDDDRAAVGVEHR